MDGRDYLYVSDAKVDKILQGLEEPRKRKYAGKLGINFGLEAGVTVTGTGNQNRLHRLAAAEKWIQATEKPQLKDSGASWLEDSAEVSAAVFDQEDDVMFFFADSDGLFLGLAGAEHNMIGNVRPTTAYASATHLHRLMEKLRGMVGQQARYLDNSDLSISAYVNSGVEPFGVATPWTRILSEVAGMFGGDPTQKVSFLAKSLTSEVVDGKRWTLATPLYIALEDRTGWARLESS